MDEAEISEGKNTSQGLYLGDNGLECDNELSARSRTFKHFEETMDLFQQCKMIRAQRALHATHRYLKEVNPDSFSNPTDYEKQQVKRGREMFRCRIAAPPFLGVVLLDQLIPNTDDHFYGSFTNVFGAVAFKLHKYDVAIEVFQLSDTYFVANAPQRREANKEYLDFLAAVAKTNVSCVYLIMRNLDKAKEYLECALKMFERVKFKTKEDESVEMNIVAAQNNLSLVFQGQKNYPAAMKIQNCLLVKAKDLNLPPQMVAAIHYNRAELFLEINDPVKALMELEKLDSLSEVMNNNEDQIFVEFVSSKICLVYQKTGALALAEETVERLIISSLYPKSSSSPSSSSSTSFSSASVSSSLSSSSVSSSSSSSSSSSLSSSSLASSLFSFSPSDFESFLKFNGKLPWDFSLATIINLVEFYLNQENVEFLSFLDVFVSGCKETFGKDHPTFASLLFRQGVRFSLMEQNASSKHCFEEVLSIFTSSNFGPTHPEVLKCNVALARLLACETFEQDQPITRTNQSACEEPCKETKVFIFLNSTTSSSAFNKLAKQIIKNEEKIGEISEVVMKINLLKLQGPSIGEVSVWPHDSCIKIQIQVPRGSRKQNSDANSKEIMGCSCSVIMKVLVEEVKICASSLGMPLRAYPENILCNCLQPSRIPAVLLPNSVGEIESEPPPLFSPITVKIEKKEPSLESLNIAQREIECQEVSLVKPCFVENWEDFACDVTDGVANPEIPSFRDVNKEQDHNEELEGGKRHISGQENCRSRHKSPRKDGNRVNKKSQKTMERPNLAAGGGNPDVMTTNEACGFQEHLDTQAVAISQRGKDAHERDSRKKRSFGLKGGQVDEFPSSHSSHEAASAYVSEASHLGICPSFLARHSDDYDTSLAYDSCNLGEDEERPSDILSMYNRFGYFPEKKYHTLQSPSTFRECPDFTECSAREHSAYTTTMGSPAQTCFNPSSYQPQLPFLNLVLTPTNDAVKNLKPPPSASFHYQESEESLPMTGGDVSAGSAPSRPLPNVSASADVLSQTPTSSSQVETEKKAPGILSNEEDTAPRLGLSNSNSNISDDDSLAALERRVAEACSLVETVLKEREEKGKAIQERERRQREERTRRQQQECERREREAWEAREAVQRTESGESISTGSGEETPVQHAAIPESPQWLCEHYQRLCRVKFPCCGKFYPCHRCHNNSGCQNDNSKAKEAFSVECSVCRHQQEVCIYLTAKFLRKYNYF